MATTRGDRLRIARERLFATSLDAARALGIPPASYWQYEHAELSRGRDYGPNEAERFARRFRVSPEWLLTGRGRGIGKTEPIEPPDASKVPVVGYVGPGARAHFHAAAQGEVDRPTGAPASTVALEIRGDSLGGIFDRWLIYYDSVRRPATPEQMGELCAVGLADGRVLIKQLQRGRREGRFNLGSPNQAPINDIAVDWAAGVTWMSRS
jgi:SOS-response transcriptional repressor LexA